MSPRVGVVTRCNVRLSFNIRYLTVEDRPEVIIRVEPGHYMQAAVTRNRPIASPYDILKGEPERGLKKQTFSCLRLARPFWMWVAADLDSL